MRTHRIGRRRDPQGAEFVLAPAPWRRPPEGGADVTYGPASGEDDTGQLLALLWAGTSRAPRVLRLLPSARPYLIGDLPLPPGTTFDGNEQTIRPPSGASCCLYAAGRDIVIRRCRFQGSVLQHRRAAVSNNALHAGGPEARQLLDVVGEVPVAPGAWLWVHAGAHWHCTRTVAAEPSGGATRLTLLDPLPARVPPYSSVMLSRPQHQRPWVSGAGLVRIEAAPSGLYLLGRGRAVPGPTTNVTIEDCEFGQCPVGVQLDSFTCGGAIVGATLARLAQRGGGTLATIVEGPAASEVRYADLDLDPQPYRLGYWEHSRWRYGASHSLIWRDRREWRAGSTRILPEPAREGARFRSLSLRHAAYGVVSIATENDVYELVRAQGISEALFWFDRSHNHEVADVATTYVRRLARVDETSTRIRIRAVLTLAASPCQSETLSVAPGDELR